MADAAWQITARRTQRRRATPRPAPQCAGADDRSRRPGRRRTQL